MLNSILIGQYIPAESFLHRLDPRTKLLSMFIIVIAVFTVKQPYEFVMLLVLTCAAYYLSGLQFMHLYRGMRPLLWLIYFTLILHILLNKQGELWLDLNILSIYSQGVIQGLLIGFRLFVILFFSTLLTLTTAPLTLTEGMEALMSPFKKLLPVHEIALMLTISIRFIPTILRETDKLIKAQTARGGSIGKGSIFKRIPHVIALMVPLLVMSFKRAEDLATAMEARGYRGSEGRSKFKQLNFHWRDYLATTVVFLIIAAVLYGRTMGSFIG